MLPSVDYQQQNLQKFDEIHQKLKKHALTWRVNICNWWSQDVESFILLLTKLSQRGQP